MQRSLRLVRSLSQSASSAASVGAASEIAPRKRNKLEKRIDARRKEVNDFMMKNVPCFEKTVGHQMVRKPASILQLNIGLHCNQSCTHCHVDSSPQRWEMMDENTAQQILKLLEKSETIDTVDITGGAPELNKMFKTIVEGSRRLDKQIINRCNLTVLFEPHQEYLPQYFVDNKIHIVASLPCYTRENVNKQRGDGVFSKSIKALEILNKHGFGMPESGLQLDLVYNPGGAVLPGAQAELEEAYKSHLKEDFGLHFSKLLTITNMPINRFADFLYRENLLTEYMTVLVNAFNPATVDSVMCRDLVNVRWDGTIFDCDFNQMLELPIGAASSLLKTKLNDGSADQSSHKTLPTVFDLESFSDLTGAQITTGPHCYGCTAGAGSSCQGAVA